MLTAVTGIKWGDEGKGRVIDLLAERADIVVRYQGGNNAGHTVVTKQGKFILNLLPSGILHPNVVCVLADGMVVDLEHCKDLYSLWITSGKYCNQLCIRIMLDGALHAASQVSVT